MAQSTAQRAQARAPRAAPVIEVDAQLFADAHKLGADVTKALLSIIKQQPDLWQKQDENDQERTIQRCQDAAYTLVHKVVEMVVADGLEAYPVAFGKIDVEKAITIKVSTPCTDDAMINVFRGRAEQWMLVRADERHYLGGDRPKPDNIGTLKLPKGKVPDPKPEARKDEAQLATVGQGTVSPEAKAALDDAEKALAKEKARQKLHHGVPVADTAAPSNEQQRPEGEGEKHDPATGELPKREPMGVAENQRGEFYDSQDDEPPAPGNFGDAKPGDKLN